MRVLYLPCHSVLEYDEVRLLHSLGHEVASIGAYINPAQPLDNIRPPLPEVPMVELVKREVDALGQKGHTDTIDAAKRHLPDAIIDWAEVIIVSGMEHAYLIPQWQRVKHKRVIWRTIGQSAHPNEWLMQPLRAEGCQIVRYSPKEANIPEYAGHDAIIRFYKDPDEFTGWTGENAVVTNITQNLYQRSLADDGALQMKGYQWTSFSFWQQATEGLPNIPAGMGADVLGGQNGLVFEDMKALLRTSRAYVATGTQPASYTLNAIEAMMTGIPVVAVGPAWYSILPYGHLLYEMHELAPLSSDDPKEARKWLEILVNDIGWAREVGMQSRIRALGLFAKPMIARQWAAFLDGGPVREASDYLGPERVPPVQEAQLVVP